MRIPFGKSSVLALAVAGLLSVSGCSSTLELQEPKMEPLESPLQLSAQWVVYQGALDKHDTKALTIATYDNLIFVANNNGRMVAIDRNSPRKGEDSIVWQTGFSERIISGPVLDNGHLLIGTDKGHVKALDAQSGKLLWQTQLSSEVLSSAFVQGDKLFTRTGDGKVYALSRNTGEVIWTSEHQMPKLSLRGAPQVIANDEMVFVAWESGIVQALQAQSGELLWESRVAIPSGRTDLERMVDIQANLVLKDNVLYALGYHGKFVAINIETGNFLFVNEISGYRDFVVGEQVIYLVDEDDVLMALDLYSGTQLWKQNTMKGRMLNDLSLHNNQLIAAIAGVMSIGLIQFKAQNLQE